MNKKIIFIFVIALILGYFAGNSTLFSPKETKAPYTYNFQAPSNLKGEGTGFSEIVKILSPTVVNISTTKTVKREIQPFSQFFESPLGDFFEPFNMPKKWKEQSLGSGVIVSSDGYIITNSHVVEKADEIKVTLYDKEDYSGKIIGSDPKTDIAVIKISAKEDLPAIKWGDSDSLQVGEFVLAFGNSFGLSHTVTLGIVSALGRANVGIADYEDFIQTDAAINPGNSGGPLVNVKGELVGINTAIFSRTGGYQGIGFAVPSNMVKSVMSELIKGGKVTRGWLGVTIQDVTPELAGEFGLKESAGAIITDIFNGSPAEKSGMKRGDIIIEVEGKEVKNVVSLRNMIAQSKVGSILKLKVIRDGKTIPFEVAIVEFPSDTSEIASHQSEEAVSDENSLAGFRVLDLTDEIAKQLGLSNKEKGVVIVSVIPNSASDEAGLKKGDVVQEINKKRVSSLSDFNKAVSRLRDGDMVLLFINRNGKKFYVPFKVHP
ncbi:MAG: DegQ family serine endoprotease [Nitrospirae bacterium]|nr:DegQ family serine endoprotease [Nitrospirota bacterium]